MTARQTIPGTIGVRELATMTNKPTPASALQTPPHVQQIADARRNARAALAALQVVDASALTGQQFEALSRCAVVLSDVADELQRLESRVREGQR
jgi:hypothetical protein